jgi:hypothetical protein
LFAELDRVFLSLPLHIRFVANTEDFLGSLFSGDTGNLLLAGVVIGNLNVEANVFRLGCVLVLAEICSIHECFINYNCTN